MIEKQTIIVPATAKKTCDELIEQLDLGDGWTCTEQRTVHRFASAEGSRAAVYRMIAYDLEREVPDP